MQNWLFSCSLIVSYIHPPLWPWELCCQWQQLLRLCLNINLAPMNLLVCIHDGPHEKIRVSSLFFWGEVVLTRINIVMKQDVVHFIVILATFTWVHQGRVSVLDNSRRRGTWARDVWAHLDKERKLDSPPGVSGSEAPGWFHADLHHPLLS